MQGIHTTTVICSASNIFGLGKISPMVLSNLRYVCFLYFVDDSTCSCTLFISICNVMMREDIVKCICVLLKEFVASGDVAEAGKVFCKYGILSQGI